MRRPSSPAAIVVGCLERLGADPPLRVRLGSPAESWRSADRASTEDTLALARRDLEAARELQPIWSARDRVAELLEGLIATAEWVCAQSPALRHRIARALGAGTQTETFASLAAHRSAAMYDALRRDLERIVSRVFKAVSAAQSAGSAA